MELARIKLFMESADPQERKNAALALAEQDPSVAAGPLAQLLKDANQAVSEAAQMSLSLLGGRATIEALVPLLSSPIAALRNAAIEVLRKVGQDDLDLLHGLTGNSDDHVRIFSVDIIGSIASPSVWMFCANVCWTPIRMFVMRRWSRSATLAPLALCPRCCR